MNCPNCAAERQEFAFECASCGIVFSKWVTPERKVERQFEKQIERRRAVSVADEPLPRDGKIGRTELIILGSGLVAAVVVHAVSFLQFVFRALVTLLHEFGHAVFGWLMGYPSIPAFDFQYGGGVTPHGEFRLSIVLAIAGGFAYVAYLYRRNRRTLMVVGAIFLVWLFFVSSEWRRDFLFIAAGHASELILAAIFFYMALAGVGLRMPEVERPLSAFVAFFVTINAIVFARQLRNDPDYLEWYREGKRGMLNDLEHISLDVRIHLGAVNVDIPTVAGWLMAFSIVPFAVALLWYFNRTRCHRILQSLLRVAPIILLTIFIPWPARAALSCYAEECIPLVYRLEETPQGIRARLGGKWMTVENSVRTITFDGAKWNESAGIVKPDRGEKSICPKGFVQNEEAQTLCAATDRFIYGGLTFYDGEGITGTGGLLRYDKQTKKVERRPLPLLRHVSVSSIAADGETLWFGTTKHEECLGLPFVNGLVRYEWPLDRVSTYEGSDDGPIGFVIHDLLLRDRALWVATDLGISRLDRRTGKWRHWLPVEWDGKISADELPAERILATLLETIPASCLISDNFSNQLREGLQRFRPRFLKRYDAR